MAEYRLGRGWTRRELADRLAGLDALPLNFSDDEAGMTRERGWSSFDSQARIASEAPGIPVPGGPFERACELVASYAFSDPRIVRAHFDPRAPLVGRRMLLELHVVGLRYLCGVVVDAERDERDAARTVWGFRYATLAGHVESGVEWFLVTKEHEDGTIRFCIRACWRRGALPNWWSRVGFALLVTHYQRVWRRLAYLRLRRMLGATRPPIFRGEHRLHTVPALANLGEPLVERPADHPYEHDEKGVHLMSAKTPTLTRPMALGAIAGLRSLIPPALLSRALARSLWPRSRPLRRRLASPRVAAVLSLFALGELVADKLPRLPSRTTAAPLLARAVSGAVVAAAAAPRRASKPGAAFAGGLAAVAAAFVAARARRYATSRLGLPDALVALIEDACALVAGQVLVKATT